MKYRVHAWGNDREWTVPPLNDYFDRKYAEDKAAWWKQQPDIIRVEIEEIKE